MFFLNNDPRFIRGVETTNQMESTEHIGKKNKKDMFPVFLGHVSMSIAAASTTKLGPVASFWPNKSSRSRS